MHDKSVMLLAKDYLKESLINLAEKVPFEEELVPRETAPKISDSSCYGLSVWKKEASETRRNVEFEELAPCENSRKVGIEARGHVTSHRHEGWGRGWGTLLPSASHGGCPEGRGKRLKRNPVIWPRTLELFITR